MRSATSVLGLTAIGAVILAAATCANTADAASHPPGVTYPLTPAAIQPAGLAHPLPSTRRYVLVWQDQLSDANNTYSVTQKQWIVSHFVGTQKVFQRQIDEFRTMAGGNPNFLNLVYHLAYGLNGADQTNPVGNITGANRFGQEDTDTFTPYVQSPGIDRESLYQHSATPISIANRVSYPDPYWLMDVTQGNWQSYLNTTLVTWMGYATTKSDGVFLDVAFPPWYNYKPDMWWTTVAGGSSRTALRDYWNREAGKYFSAMQMAFAASTAHPRYLVIPNTDALVDGTDEPGFLGSTDGVFTENWQAVAANAGDWNLSVRRIVQYVTGKGKVWMTDITKPATDLAQADREMLIGTYLLVRNATSYIMFGNGDLRWYPEYEIDLGAYDAEPPADLETLKVAGAGGSGGGLYARSHARGVVLVNSSAAALSYNVASAMKRAAWSGGGAWDAPMTVLTYDTDVPAGPLSVPARSVVVLRDPAGAPPAGQEPGGGDAGAATGAANGTTGSAGSSGATSASTSAASSTGSSGTNATTSTGTSGTSATSATASATGSAASGSTGSSVSASTGAPAPGEKSGCGCRIGRGPNHPGWLLTAGALALVTRARRKPFRRLNLRRSR